jgi:hypothetical protein
MTENNTDSGTELQKPHHRNHRYLLALLAVTLLIQGVMFISYPLGNSVNNDNQAGQVYLMDQFVSGNFMVGNVRYNPGYALVLAPFKALTDNFGRLAPRALLVVHLLIYSTIPFMAYDIMRRRFSETAGFITGLIVLLDPFGLQWAHFQLPGWLIAFVMVWALWMAQLAWETTTRRRFMLIGLASVALGVMTFARFNFSPLVALYGMSFFLWRHIPLKQRFALFIMVGMISVGILGGYIVGIHIPSTGTTTLSCITGNNMATGLLEKEIPMRASNGPKSEHYALMLTLKADRTTDFYEYTYPLWQNPKSWVSEDELEAFLAQPFGTPQEEITTVFPAELYWYLGPCDADAMLFEVYGEAIAREPLKLLVEALKSTLYMLIQHPTETSFHHMYIDRVDDINWSEDGWLGFYEADSTMYNGHLVWQPGMWLYTILFTPLNLIKLLTPFAVIWAFWKRDWFTMIVAILLVIGLLLIAGAARMEPRYYAMLSPLFTILIGGFLADMYHRVRQ